MSTPYTYTVSTDTANGLLVPLKLHDEVAAAGLTSATYENVVPDFPSDAFDVNFDGAISAGDKTTLDGIVAAHDGVPLPVPGPDTVSIEPIIGGQKMDVDGVSFSAAADVWHSEVYVMPEPLHVDGLPANWKHCLPGDYAWIVVIHPQSASPDVQANSGQTDVTLANSGLADVFDPANGAKYMEFWNGTALVEVVKIASRSGAVITLASNLQETHATGITLHARYDGFAPVRGTHGLDGGFRLLNSDSMLLRNEIGITAAIPAGLHLCARLRTTTAAGTRDFTINYIFRKPAV